MERSWSAAASQSKCSTQTAMDQSERVYNPDVRALHRNVNKPKSYISFGRDKGAIHSSAADERTSSPLYESRKRRYRKEMARTKQTDRQPKALGHRPATVPAICLVCDRNFSQRSNLERHMAAKHRQRLDGTRATEDDIQRARSYNIRGRRDEGCGSRTTSTSGRPQATFHEYADKESTEGSDAAADSESSDTTMSPPQCRRSHHRRSWRESERMRSPSECSPSPSHRSWRYSRSPRRRSRDGRRSRMPREEAEYRRNIERAEHQETERRQRSPRRSPRGSPR